MTTLGTRIKMARTAIGLSQQALADAISQLGSGSISRTAIAQWETGLTKEIEASNLVRASKVLNVTPEWLLFGEDDCQEDISFSKSLNAVSSLRKIPWLTDKQVAIFMDTIDSVIKSTTESVNLGLDHELSSIAGPNVFSFTIKDDSMYPLLKQGDIIIVDPDVKPNPGEIVVAKILPDNRVIVRKYRPLNSNEHTVATFELIARNPDWPTIAVNNKNQGCVIGTLIEHRCRRRLK